MGQCVDNRNFVKIFRGNMRSLGLTPPISMFNGFQQSLTHAMVMASALDSLGRNATMGEIIGATSGLEKLKTVSGLYGAFYVGAVIGSLVVASAHSGACSAKRADLLAFVQRNNLRFPGDMTFYNTHPEVLSGPNDRRLAYAALATKRAA